MNKFFECVNHYPRKYSKGILKAEGHYCVLKADPLWCKGIIMSIFFHDLDLIVSREPINKRVYLFSSNALQHLICKWCGEGIM